MRNIRPSQIGQYIRRALRLHFIPVVLVAAPSVMANTNQETEQLETLVVTASALKVETPAQETPKALSIVTQEEIVARAPQNWMKRCAIPPASPLNLMARTMILIGSKCVV